MSDAASKNMGIFWCHNSKCHFKFQLNCYVLIHADRGSSPLPFTLSICNPCLAILYFFNVLHEQNNFQHQHRLGPESWHSILVVIFKLPNKIDSHKIKLYCWMHLEFVSPMRSTLPRIQIRSRISARCYAYKYCNFTFE